jgi:hypothetical protein
MSYRPGDTLYASFATQSIAGSSADADSTPTASLRRNGTVDGAITVTLTHNATGDYTASASLPLTYSGGDNIELLVSATVGGVAGKSVLPMGILDRTAQTVAQVVYRTDKVHFVSAAGGSSYDGLSPQTAKALPTQPTPGAGETILVFSGTFAMNTTPLDLSGDGTIGVHLIGAAMGATLLTSNVLLTDGYAIVKPGNGSLVADLTIQGIAATSMTTNMYQAPLGAAGGQSPFLGAVANHVQLIGDSDGIYIDTPSDRNTLFVYNSSFQTKYDCINLLATADSFVELHDCELSAAGPSMCNSGNTARALVCRTGSVNMFGGTLTASGASTTTRAVQTTNTGVANLYRVEMTSAAATGTVFDLDNSGTSVAVYDCAYNPAKITGAITVQNIPGTLAPSQDFNNTGQTTPVPSAAAFTGPNSVTLIFHDAGGSPVPDVVFTVVGVGSAVADGAGSRTIALSNGTYTIRAVPTSSTLWADTSITVTTSATFTLVGTAIVIPPPSDPSQTTAYLTTRDGQGNAQPNTTLTFQLIDPDAATDSYNQANFSATSDSSALLQVALLQATKYQARVGSGAWVAFTTGTGGTYALPEILGPQ